ncbi:MAG: TonB-dependent receptor [Verrucomicrobia bacterium]|nr:TonB-dependent receptor [Verrucomicrobiota bacterium]
MNSASTLGFPRALRHFGVAILTALLAALPSGQAASPTTPATVNGRVTDGASGDALSNAIITVAGSPVSAATDLDGTYTLQLPPGSYQLTARYAGMDDMKQTIEVSAGQTATRHFSLVSSVQKLDAYVVRALRAGQAAAIHEERHAPNVRTVAEIDTFGNPGAQAGELLQRLAGIAVDGSGGQIGAVYVRGMTQDFSSLLVDGNQIATSGGTSVTNGNVYFGQVSTGNISSLEIIKAPTPEMDGNAIAGYLNMRTRRTFERGSGRIVTFTAGTSWANNHEDPTVPYRDRPELDLASLTYSEVFSLFGGKNNVGIAASATRNIGNGTIIEVGPRQASAAQTGFFVPLPAAGEKPQPLARAVGAGQWGSVPKQSGDLNLGFNADWKVTDSTVLYMKTTYSRVKRRSGSSPSYFRWKLTTGATAANFLPGSTYDLLEARNGTLDLESVLYIRESEGTAVSGGLEQKFMAGTAKLTAEASFSRNRTMYPELNQLFARMTGVGWQLDRRGRDPWVPLVRQTAGADWSDPASYTVRADSQLISYSAPAMRWGGRTDFEKNFFGAHPFTFKTGIKQSNFYQKANRDLYYYTYAGPATTPATGGTKPWVGYNMKMTYGAYGPFPFLQLPRTGMAGDVWADRNNWRQTSSDVWNTIYNSTLNDVEFTDRVTAGYVQANSKFGPLRVMTGIRLEETKTSGSSYTRAAVSAATNTNLGTLPVEQNAARARANFLEWDTQGTKYRNTFPGIHLAYSLGTNWQARASYNVSITRPSPANLLPNMVVNEEAQTISAGNPALKPYTSDNFDVSVARYFSGIGQISAGAFLKEITNYFRSFRDTVPAGANNGFNGEYEGWTITQNRNVGSARIRGIELNYQQQYTFLPGFWRGFGSFANYTFIETWGDFGSLVGYTSKLPNLTPHSWNGGITYAAGGLAVRLLANYRSEFYRSTATGTLGSGAGVLPGTYNFEVYQHSRTLVDLKIQYSFGKRYILLFDVYNLTRDYGANDFAHFLGYEVPSYASGAGTSYKLGLTTRF